MPPHRSNALTMTRRHVRLVGPRAGGERLRAATLRQLLAVLIDGSQRALRLRLQGRSTARGTPPAWIVAATDFEVRLRSGSTVLEIDAPTLDEAAPDQFAQGSLFSEVDAGRPAIDYLFDSLEAALDGESQSPLYDGPLLSCLSDLGSIFAEGIEVIEFDTPLNRLSRTRAMREPDVAGFRELARSIPRPQQTRLVGKLDMIRDSDRTFQLQVAGTGGPIKGIAHEDDDLTRMFAEEVLVSGVAYFAANGAVQRIEADGPLREPLPEERRIFAAPPRPLARPMPPSTLRVQQGPKSGLNAIFGKWPGDESDGDLAAALGELS